MPSSDSGENRRPSKPQMAGAPAPDQEHLQCPRCDSINTKFCYYNNYNYSQPRHFCKACRRYWTHGGTLRDIPVGGGSRKNAKRSRTSGATATNSSSSFSIATSSASVSGTATPVLVPLAGNQGGSMPFGATGGMDGDVTVKQNANMCGTGTFTSLLNNTQGSGFLGLGGFGLGVGHGFEDIGFGIGRGGWSFPAMMDGASNGGSIVGPNPVGNLWQLESGEGGFVGGDCFPWPGLAISTPGNGLK